MAESRAPEDVLAWLREPGDDARKVRHVADLLRADEERCILRETMRAVVVELAYDDDEVDAAGP